MREIKFKGLRVDDKGWVYGKVFNYSSRNQIKTYIQDGKYAIKNGSLYGWEVIPESVSEFTGLKDKNGTEIYEGDIIQYKSYHANKRWWSTTKEIPIIEKEVQKQREDFSVRKTEVAFRDGCFKLDWGLTFEDVSRGQKFETGSTHSCEYEKKSWGFEVIGNIHQNKDLLK